MISLLFVVSACIASSQNAVLMPTNNITSAPRLVSHFEWSVVQVNVTNREAALSPPSSDSLAAFAGDYVTYILPDKEGYPATKTRTLCIASNADGELQFNAAENAFKRASKRPDIAAKQILKLDDLIRQIILFETRHLVPHVG